MRLSLLVLTTGLLTLTLLACGGDDDSTTPSQAGGAAKTIGSSGGNVSMSGASVEVPAGALAADKKISVSALSSAAAKSYLDLLDQGAEPVSAVYALTPHGAQFEKPVTISVKYTGAADGLTLQRLDDEKDQTWEQVANVKFAAGKASFESSHFSLIVVTSAAPAASPLDAGKAAADASAMSADSGTTQTDSGTGSGGTGAAIGDPGPAPTGGDWACGEMPAGCDCRYQVPAMSGVSNTCKATYTCCVAQLFNTPMASPTCTCLANTSEDACQKRLKSTLYSYSNRVRSCPQYP